MNGARFPQRDADAVRVRIVIEAIERELSLLPTSGDDRVGAIQTLRRSWAELVELLALGPAPETRQCPICGHLGMRAATRCGGCWRKLSPLDADAGEVPRTRVASSP